MSYKEFLNISEIKPPENLSHEIMNYVHKDLHPSLKRVYLKLLGIHIFVGALTLFLCPQFGIGPFMLGPHGLMGPWMSYGVWACALFCGSFFLGATTLVALALLRAEEIKVLSQHQIVAFTSLSFLSLVLFLLIADMRNAETLFQQYEYVVLWGLGGVLTAELILYVGTAKKALSRQGL